MLEGHPIKEKFFEMAHGELVQYTNKLNLENKIIKQFCFSHSIIYEKVQDVAEFGLKIFKNKSLQKPAQNLNKNSAKEFTASQPLMPMGDASLEYAFWQNHCNFKAKLCFNAKTPIAYTPQTAQAPQLQIPQTLPQIG